MTDKRVFKIIELEEMLHGVKDPLSKLEIKKKIKNLKKALVKEKLKQLNDDE